MEENKIVLPDEYKEKGWAKSILNDAGDVDMSKVFSKIDGQESLLGKKQIPGKNSTDEEWAKFNAQITADYEDGEYDAVLDGLETKADMVKALKGQGLTPKQAAKVAELYKAEKAKTAEKIYNEEEFKSAIRESMDEKTYDKVKAHLEEIGQWEDVKKMSNAAAIKILKSNAALIKKYGVEDKPNHDGGNPAESGGNGKGFNNQEYVSRVYELMREGKTHSEAIAQAKREFS